MFESRGNQTVCFQDELAAGVVIEQRPFDYDIAKERCGSLEKLF
jgi:hypothetical protein